MTRFELATPTLARLCATTAPHPHVLFQEQKNYDTKLQSLDTQKRESSLSRFCIVDLLVLLDHRILTEAVCSLAVNHCVDTSDLIFALYSKTDCLLDCEANNQC